jgi:hypothetical protein
MKTWAYLTPADNLMWVAGPSFPQVHAFALLQGWTPSKSSLQPRYEEETTKALVADRGTHTPLDVIIFRTHVWFNPNSPT